jgi:hypothetical protein
MAASRRQAASGHCSKAFGTASLSSKASRRRGPLPFTIVAQGARFPAPKRPRREWFLCPLPAWLTPSPFFLSIA